ncbi:MAG: heparinase II/III family protein [Phycisphaerae bacterium]|nr:heparinase II/III family protein [Phycisphaerae bacterium]
MFKGMITTVFFFLLTLLVVCSSDGCAKAESQPAAAKSSIQSSPSLPGVLASLRKEHPRLLFTRADQQRVEKLVKKNPLLADMIAQLKLNAEKILKQGVIEYDEKGIKKSVYYFLRQGWGCIDRVLTLSMAYRLTGDRRFFERARKEMLSIVEFPTWHPYHFLDVAQMCYGIAVGYDWLYDDLSVADRLVIRKAIVSKALMPGLDVYTGKAKNRWDKRGNNWNQVCNGALVLGALAVAEHEPKIARKIISHARRSIRIGMRSYEPEGAWDEGPGYWGYGTTYNALLIAALDSALGNDLGLTKKAKGFKRTGDFIMQMFLPSRAKCFNYADSGSGYGISPEMFWLARKFDKPMLAWFERQRIQMIRRNNPKFAFTGCRHNSLAMAIAWFDGRGKTPKSGELPRDSLFRGRADIVAIRSTWEDKALYIGFKGGNNSLGPHMHMDIGSFVIEADGVSWAVDLGGDNYRLPGYWKRGENGQRWKYYRIGSKSHNTLVIGNKLQRVKGSTSKVIKFLSTPARAHAVLDMSNAYRGQAKKVLRGVAMLDRSRILIQDEVGCTSNDEIRWGMATRRAKIKLDGATATLTKDGKTLQAKILSPAGAKFEIVSPPAPIHKKERPNKGVSMLVFRVKPENKKQLRMVILLTPVGEQWKKLPPPKIQSLNKWEKHTKKQVAH